jgi:uncharacterized phage-associated protein
MSPPLILEFYSTAPTFTDENRREPLRLTFAGQLVFAPQAVSARVSATSGTIEYMFDLLVGARIPGSRSARPYDDAMTTAHTVAAEIRRHLPGVGEVKLHKLLYYAQGHHLATFGAPLFVDTISAWDMGPVVGTLRHAEHNGVVLPEPEDLEEAQLNTIGYVLSRYGRMTGGDLIRLSHAEAPWREADAHRVAGTSVRISNDRIREYFLAVRDEDEAEPIDDQLLAQMLEGAQQRLQRPARADSLEDLRARQQASLG